MNFNRQLPEEKQQPQANIPNRAEKERLFEALETLKDSNGNPSAIIRNVCFNALANYTYICNSAGHLNGIAPNVDELQALWGYAEAIEQKE